MYIMRGLNAIKNFSKSELSYMKAKHQFDNDVLLSNDWYNGIISCRINKNI